MFKKIAATAGTMVATCAIGTAHAQDKPGWTGPFGGTFTAGMTIASDYSYRGISQTQREFAFQPSFGYETPTRGPTPITAYVSAWGSK